MKKEQGYVELHYLRPYTPTKGKHAGKEKLAAKFTNIKLDSHDDLFDDLESVLEQIPKKERWNVYYTANKTDGEGERNFLQNSHLWFDIDNIDTARITDYKNAFFEFTQLDPTKTVVVFSGNGLQFLVKRNDKRDDPRFFNESKRRYADICTGLNKYLEAKGLIIEQEFTIKGKQKIKRTEADTNVWDATRLLRIPETENRKDGRGVKQARILNRILLPQSVESLNKIQIVDDEDQAKNTQPNNEYIEWTGTVDENYILGPDGCPALKHFKDQKGDVSEPAWYAALSIIGRFEDGIKVAQELSSGHPSYSPEETETKALQAIHSSGPRTCRSFSESYDQCKGCKYNGIVHSPIQLISDDTITTSMDGYHKKTKKGQWVPHYPDMIKEFTKAHEFFVDSSTHSLFVYKKTHWVEMTKPHIKAFGALLMTVPALHKGSDQIQPANRKVEEFYNRLMNMNVVKGGEEIYNYSKGKINFLNGVYCFKEGFIPHNDKTKLMYFMSVLDFEYNPESKAPRFDKFLDEITLDRNELKENLLRFAGYGISNAEYKHHKCLILVGDGANGKSTFMNVIQNIVDEKFVANLSIKDLGSEQQRAELMGKLLNISEETPTNALVDSSAFKAVTAGGRVPAKVVYKPAFSFRNNAKFIFACNELPRATDWTTGFKRRVIIIPFEATFRGKQKDNNLESKLNEERAGIVNMIIEANKRLNDENYFIDSEVSKKALEQYHKEFGSSLEYYLEQTGFDFYDEEKHDEADKEECQDVYLDQLFMDYKQFCLDTGERYAMSKRSFSRHLNHYLKRRYNEVLDSHKTRKRLPMSGRTACPKPCFIDCLWHPHTKAQINSSL